MKMPIIALGRQFGSGGREIGKRLAEKLNIRCYDRELITLAAQKAELREELFAGREEKKRRTPSEKLINSEKNTMTPIPAEIGGFRRIMISASTVL